jgi:hypothetical protein
MTTWTDATSQAETWTTESFPIRVFSPLVFSHAYAGALRVFAIGSSAGVWDGRTIQTETWTAE